MIVRGPIALALFLCAAPHSAIASDSDTAAHAAALERDARSNLGVGLRSLAFLFDAGPENVLLVDALQDNGSWGALKELERAGLVTLSQFSSSEGQFVTIILTSKGRSVVAAFAAP